LFIFTVFIQGFQDSKDNREKQIDYAVSSYLQLMQTDNSKYISQDSVEKKCDSLKEKWSTLNRSIPERVESLTEELQSWSRFYLALEEFVTWLKEMEALTHHEKPKDEKDAKKQLKDLEVRYCQVVV